MEAHAINIEKGLMRRLEEMGVEPSQIPFFIRDMRNSFLDDPYISLFQANSHLHSLGWDDVQLDYPAFLLAQELFKEGAQTA